MYVMRSAIPCVVAFVLAMLVGCFGDDSEGGDDTRSGPTDGGLLIFDMSDATVTPACPESIPRIGETCPTIEEHSTVCTYTIDQCSANGSIYDKTNDFCCMPRGTWYACGMNETPCDRAAAEDAAAASD
jgi:hypothetical protein